MRADEMMKRELVDALDSALQENEELKRLLLDVDDTALRSGVRWGLLDATDNDGEGYQSWHAAKWLRRIRSEVDARAAALRATPSDTEGTP